MRMHPRLVAASAALGVAGAFLPFQNPPWGAANWQMWNSTISMACNQSGFFDPALASQFGIISFDWSNNKATWAAAKPMSDLELLVQQAHMTKAANPQARVFTYFNLVKALPWMSVVREKLEDPAYAGFFLSFKPGGSLPNGSYHVPNCDTFYDPPLCTTFYHDQEQTPEVPTPSNPNPDGRCDGKCDCGKVPCGEYLWDHRNASLRSWLVNEVLLGPYFVGSGIIDGMFIDDFWCSDRINGSGACTDPVQGPTEVDPHSQVDMGLSDDDIADLTTGWLQTMTDAQAALLSAGAYTWSLIPGQANANAAPRLVDAASCTATLRKACVPGNAWATAPLLAGLHPGNATVPLPYLMQDLAAFLLMRGPFAYIGYGVWGMSWPAGSSFISPNGTSLPLPPALSTDYGVPLDEACAETAPGSSIVFTRSWSKADVTLDCNTYTAQITMKDSPEA